jgi:formylglycine-generating enzyme required for sulfatase activity
MNAPQAVAEALPQAVNDGFISTPEITLPNGTVVPPFLIGQYNMSRGDDDKPVINVDLKPWVNISYNRTLEVIADAGDIKLLTGTQALAIAYDISQQDDNWTGGKVGEGAIYMGLHKGNVYSAQDGTYESQDPEERRWHVLSNGERIYDFAGNVYAHIFDDIHGDTDTGVVNQRMPADSPYLTTAPFPSMEKGTGWRPDGARNWSGYALVRGGCWYSDDDAGVFRLRSLRPGYDFGDVGFRCTKSL